MRAAGTGASGDRRIRLGAARSHRKASTSGRRSPLARLAFMSEERRTRVVVRGCELATRETGAGVPFLWAHGLLSSMAQEDAVGLISWRDVGARVVRFDARGHGESAASYDPAELRWPALARDLLALADTLGPGPVFLGGVSRFYRFAASLVAWLGLAPFRLLASVPAAGRASPVAAFQSALLDQLARADARAVAATLRGAADSDLPEPGLLRSLRAPALILAWRNDPVHPVSTATRLHQLLPEAELRVARSLEEIRTWPERVARFVREIEPEADR